MLVSPASKESFPSYGGTYIWTIFKARVLLSYSINPAALEIPTLNQMHSVVPYYKSNSSHSSTALKCLTEEGLVACVPPCYVLFTLSRLTDTNDVTFYF
uniref:Ovule protein n=1 Tax=Ascaris lumbricoides TaxID=6252 RepID=A0A0M3I2C4_ASCLU